MHIFMTLLPLIQLPRGWGTVSYNPGPMCLFTVMMTHITGPIQGNGCSKGITVDLCISKTIGSLRFYVAANPSLRAHLPLIASMCVV